MVKILRGTGLIPGWGTKIPHAVWHSQKNKNNKKKVSVKNCFLWGKYHLPSTALKGLILRKLSPRKVPSQGHL